MRPLWAPGCPRECGGAVGRDHLSLMALIFPVAHFDYQFGYRKFDGAEGPRTHKYMNNIMEKISPNQPSEINFGKGNEKLLL